MTPEVQQRLNERKIRAAKTARRDNAKLNAGAPMYYYCRVCGAEMVLPEDHTCAAPWYCAACIQDGLASGPREAAHAAS